MTAKAKLKGLGKKGGWLWLKTKAWRWLWLAELLAESSRKRLLFFFYDTDDTESCRKRDPGT